MIRRLDVPLRSLSPFRRVYVVRDGLVYQYPASLVRDIANDIWLGDDYFASSSADRDTGALVSDHYFAGTLGNSLRSLCHMAWKSVPCQHSYFDIWWYSGHTNAPPILLGTASAHAARHLTTWSLFVRRNEVDTSGLGA